MAPAITEAIPTAASEPPGRKMFWTAPLVEPAEAEGEAALAAPVPGPAVLTASPEAAEVTVEKPDAVDDSVVEVEVAEGET